MMLIRSCLRFRFLALVLCLPLWGCGPKSALEGRNVILVVVDTLRRDRLGVHGYARGITPFMDRLAGEGICFERAVTPSSWTKPAVASLFSGLNPGRHGAIGDLGMYTNMAFFERDFTTLAEDLKRAGYRTAAFVTNANIIAFYHFDQGFDDFVQPAGLARGLLQRAKEWIESHGKQGKFFLYLHILDPHAPYFPPEEYRERFAPGGAGPRAPFAERGKPREVELWIEQFKDWKPEHPGDSFEYDFHLEQFEERLEQMAPGFDPKKARAMIHLDFQGRDDPELLRKIDYLTSLYDGEVAYSDEALNGFGEWLEETGMLDQTIFVLTSDHGEGFLEHDTWGHRRYVHGEEIDIPLIFRIPGPENTPLKGAFRDRASLVDLYPTLMDMLGLPMPEGIDGVSLWPLMNGDRAGGLRARPVITETFLDSGDHVSLVVNAKKIIRSAWLNGTVEWKYYDLVKDPAEMHPMDPDRAGEEGRTLKRAVEAYLKGRTLDLDKKGEIGIPSEEVIDQLRKLGYL
jgi:arylsulfatase A-like enzyme